MDIDLTDGQAHDVELYFLDWDSTGRGETVQISDASSGTVLDTEMISSFHSGVYLDWQLSGSVVITITHTGGANAVLSGIFFDPTPTPTSTPTPITPTITWPNPANITYGTALSSTQLDATANVPGTFTYTLAAGTVLGAGNGQTLSALFVPTDTKDYTNASATATITVTQATPTITWANPANIVYGTALSGTQLDASAAWMVGGTTETVAGTFTYSPASGTVLKSAPNQTLSVSFTPTDTTDYKSTSATATITVTQATPTITWPTPANIVSGTALSGTQLDASAAWMVGGTTETVAGTFTYSPAAGTVLPVGNDQTLSVSFAPTDTTDYTSASASATINVVPPSTSPTLTGLNFGATVDSTPVLMNGTLYFAANDGTHGTQLWQSNGTSAGTSMLTDINVKNGGLDPTDLTTVGNTLYFVANDGTHGTQLWKSDGTVSGTTYVTSSNDGDANFGIYPSYLTNVNGTLYFTGLDLDKGFQVFTSNGTAAGTAPVTNINSAGMTPNQYTPVGNLLYFQAYDPTDGYQLWDLNTTNNAVSMLTSGGPAGVGRSPQYLTSIGSTVYFSAYDATKGFQLWDYNPGTGVLTLTSGGAAYAGIEPQYLTNVNGTLFFSANDGTHGSQLWTSNGTTAGTKEITTINASDGGLTPFNLTAMGSTLFFVGNDGTHGDQPWESEGTTASTTMVADINGTWGSNATNLTVMNGLVYFTAYTALTGYQVYQSDGTSAGTVRDTNLDTGSSNVPSNFMVGGSDLYFTAPGASMWQWQPTPTPTPTPTSTPTPTTPTITWPNPANITYGTALSSTQLDATANVPGTFTYTPAAGTVLGAGNGQTLSALFVPTDTKDYTDNTATATINVTQATPTITWANPANIVYGTALSGTQLDASAAWMVGGTTGAVAGTFTYSPAAGTVLPVGNDQTLSVSFAPTDTTDYTSASASATINVVPASTAAATFLKTDTTTEGTWIGTYGADGYNVIGDTPSYPSYATVTASGNSTHVWAASTTDPRALQNPGGSGRIAAAWYASHSFTINVDFTDALTHNLELYFLDWDSTSRGEKVQISDAGTGTVLDTETISSFHSGVYLDWKVSGNILITITCTGGANAVLSGLFIDPGFSSIPSSTIEQSVSTGLTTGEFGTVEFAGSDNQAALTANSTFAAGDVGLLALNSKNTRSVTADTQRITATINVSDFFNTGAAGTVPNVMVTNHDAYGNVASGDIGTVPFETSDGQAALPADSTSMASDAAAQTISSVAKKKPGVQ